MREREEERRSCQEEDKIEKVVEKINYSNNQLEEAKCYVVLLIQIQIQVL